MTTRHRTTARKNSRPTAIAAAKAARAARAAEAIHTRVSPTLLTGGNDLGEVTARLASLHFEVPENTPLASFIYGPTGAPAQAVRAAHHQRSASHSSVGGAKQEEQAAHEAFKAYGTPGTPEWRQRAVAILQACWDGTAGRADAIADACSCTRLDIIRLAEELHLRNKVRPHRASFRDRSPELTDYERDMLQRVHEEEAS